ncbi:MAG TPA: hypothetical protein VLV89_12620 [Candidatus Acidoferrum sp.]|nr:hypothetical protein [Candidatus Acidoferrum sp.]
MAIKMLTSEQAEALDRQLKGLKCTDPKSGDGLFTFIFKGEPHDESDLYEKHLLECEYCRVASQIYRYKKDVAKLLGRG